MTKSKYGNMASCKYCDQDIQFNGKLFGWLDRGGNRSCCPFVKNGEIVKPKTKHAPYNPDTIYPLVVISLM